MQFRIWIHIYTNRTFHKEMDSLQNVCDKSHFNNWMCKLSVIVLKLDIKVKRQKIKNIKKWLDLIVLKSVSSHNWKNIKPVFNLKVT